MPASRADQEVWGDAARRRKEACVSGYVGRGTLRKEDAELVRGLGRFTENIRLAGTLHFVVVRSPFAHARITAVDTSDALEAPGVAAVFTGRDMLDDWATPLPMIWPVTEGIRIPEHWPLAPEEAKHAGDGVAV